VSSASSADPPLLRELLQTLHSLPRPSGYLVAYSGGLDSTVLLHALASLGDELQRPLRAVHVHHGLQPRADQWAEHCRRQCRRLGVPFHLVRLDLRPERRQSPEALARRARYQALADLQAPGEMVLLAHHAGDLSETLLLQLLRGAGPRGLAAMAPVKAWKQGWLARPLLHLGRPLLQRWAQAQGLSWIEDPSNADLAIPRNYLRHRILPPMRQRWPALDTTLGRAAAHCAEAAELLAELAELDLARCRAHNPWQLVWPSLAELSSARRRNLLRHWLLAQERPLPSRAVLARLAEELLDAGPQAQPRVHWPGGEVRRYRERLYLFPEPLPEAPGAVVLPWRDPGPLELPAGLGELQWLGAFPPGGVEVRFSAPGQGLGGLKKRFQALGIPPWLRPRLPLVHSEGGLLALGEWPLRAGRAAPVRWRRPPWLDR